MTSRIHRDSVRRRLALELLLLLKVEYDNTLLFNRSSGNFSERARFWPQGKKDDCQLYFVSLPLAHIVYEDEEELQAVAVVG